MGNDCSLLTDCADYISNRSSRLHLSEDQIHYEDAPSGERPKKQLRKREQSYSEPIMESFEQSIQQNLSGIPQEFLKLYEFGKLLGVGTTSKVYQIFSQTTEIRWPSQAIRLQNYRQKKINNGNAGRRR